MRFIILHHHIFKNAGSTLDSTLLREFDKGFAEFHTDVSDSGRIYPGQLVLFLDKNPHIKAVSSHHFFGCNYSEYLDYVQRNRYTFIDFILLRHPLSRLVSIYLYYRGVTEGDNQIQAMAKNSSLAEFVRYIIDNYPNFAINPQVTTFGNDFYGVPPSSKSVDKAIERLMSVVGLGVVEEYKKSMIVAEHFLQPIFAGLKLNGKSQNISSRTDLPDYDGSVESIEAIIGADLYKEISALNDFDVQLWNLVSQELDRRKSYVPHYDERLIDFNLRADI